VPVAIGTASEACTPPLGGLAYQETGTDLKVTLTGNGTQQVTPNGVVLVSTIFNPPIRRPVRKSSATSSASSRRPTVTVRSPSTPPAMSPAS
jgi:hypothetical protein